jgi:hypothetical protein
MMKALFTVTPKDRNDLPAATEFEKQVFAIKRSITGRVKGRLSTSFDQSSVLYPKRFMFDFESIKKAYYEPKEVVDAFFVAVDETGVCLSKYDVHITIL